MCNKLLFESEAENRGSVQIKCLRCNAVCEVYFADGEARISSAGSKAQSLFEDRIS